MDGQKGKVPSCEPVLFYGESVSSGQALVAALDKYHLDLKSLLLGIPYDICSTSAPLTFQFWAKKEKMLPGSLNDRIVIDHCIFYF